MNEQTRQILIGQLGTLIVANAELAAENVALARKCQEQTATIAELEAKLAEEQNAPQAGGDPITTTGTHGFVGGGGGNPPGAGDNGSTPSEIH
jgi:hypothetical protein